MARILVVDDDNAICQLFVNAFQRSGHETVVAHDGKEALERLKSEEFDAMVLDLKMPGMSGEIVLEK
jgi:CheY-like chemotaxis protein